MRAIAVTVFRRILSPGRSFDLIEDISTQEGPAAATAKLNAALLEQRIAWVAIDPLNAARVEVKDRCGLRTLARRHE